jgi:hypothetical protein
MDEFVFELGNTGKRFKGRAENSDKALVMCLKETGWELNRGIVYLGRASSVETPAFLRLRDELHYIPGTQVKHL